MSGGEGRQLRSRVSGGDGGETRSRCGRWLTCPAQVGPVPAEGRQVGALALGRSHGGGGRLEAKDLMTLVGFGSSFVWGEVASTVDIGGGRGR